MNLLLPLLLAATIPLRNPFWPVGHNGEREAIYDEPHVKTSAEPAASAEEDTKTSVTAEAIAAAAAEVEDEKSALDRLWIKARRALRIGSTIRTGGGLKTRQAVTINGRVYGDGDLVSFNHDGYRFTWRVSELTDNNTLRLVRLRARELDQEEEPKGKSK